MAVRSAEDRSSIYETGRFVPSCGKRQIAGCSGTSVPGWPTTPLDDLRVVLADCEREVDEALGVLLGSACRALALHVGFMLGEDP
jgi:hypothetical protein